MAQGRGFEPGRIFFTIYSISRFKRLIDWSSDRIKMRSDKNMRMRDSRKRLLRMRETSIFGV